ncbi:MAG: hypothetical protein EOM21_18560 [Gammaproteobacteria bacterium]|nr:hypothetical protein [Gammaproteobacteria bacterium]
MSTYFPETIPLAQAPRFAAAIIRMQADELETLPSCKTAVRKLRQHANHIEMKAMRDERTFYPECDTETVFRLNRAAGVCAADTSDDPHGSNRTGNHPGDKNRRTGSAIVHGCMGAAIVLYVLAMVIINGFAEFLGEVRELMGAM